MCNHLKLSFFHLGWWRHFPLDPNACWVVDRWDVAFRHPKGWWICHNWLKPAFSHQGWWQRCWQPPDPRSRSAQSEVAILYPTEWPYYPDCPTPTSFRRDWKRWTRLRSDAHGVIDLRFGTTVIPREWFRLQHSWNWYLSSHNRPKPVFFHQG